MVSHNVKLKDSFYHSSPTGYTHAKMFRPGLNSFCKHVSKCSAFTVLTTKTQCFCLDSVLWKANGVIVKKHTHTHTLQELRVEKKTHTYLPSYNVPVLSSPLIAACQCSHVGDNCDTTTGQCICPPNTIGERCDRCAPNHWGHDIITGCKVGQVGCGAFPVDLLFIYMFTVYLPFSLHS